MIEYFYTAKYLDPDLNSKIVMAREECCDHAADVECSFNLNDCCLQPFGIAIAMHVLADKYMIPGLKKHSCAHLEGLFSRIELWRWELDVAVWKMAYEHSRNSDDLRKLVLNRVHEALSRVNRDSSLYETTFGLFLEQSPELFVPLLKMELKNPLVHGNSKMTAVHS